MSFALHGIRVVVTGSTRGLGLAFARDLAGHGARVVINGVDVVRCAAVGEQLVDEGLDVVAVPGSVADEAVADQLVATAAERFGGIDAVVNNAGITRDGLFERLEASAFDEVVGVHLRGTWLVTRAAVRAIADGGLSVVNVTSGSSLFGLVGQSNYAAAKGGLNALTRALTVELGGRGVRVNAVYPRARTDMTARVGEVPAIADHLGRPEDVAPLVSYLVSPASVHVTGQVLAFDGRELTVWTHPSPATTQRRETTWMPDDVHAALASPECLESLHPDAIGRATWAAFGAMD